MCKVQKILQVGLDDVDHDGQQKCLVFVNGNVSEADHAFHRFGCIGLKPMRVGQQSEHIA